MKGNWFGSCGDLSDWENPDVRDEGQIKENEAIVILDAQALRKALKPMLKRKSKLTDDHFRNSVLLSFNNGTVTLRATDMITYVETYSSFRIEGSRPPEYPVAVDITSLEAVTRIVSEELVLGVLDDQVRVLFAGGSTHVPSYSLDPTKFNAGKIEWEREQRTPASFLTDSLVSLKRLASASPIIEMKMLFGASDHIYACDGISVIKSDSYFASTAIRLNDVDILVSLLATSDPDEKVVIQETSGYVRISSSVGIITFQKRQVMLAKQYTDALVMPRHYFLVDPNMILKALSMLNTIRDTGGNVTFEITPGNDGGAMLALHSKAQNGEISSMVVSRDSAGTHPKEGQFIRMTIPSAIRVLSGFAGEDFVQMGVEKKQLLIHDARATAVVIVSAIGSDAR